jgi:tRNA nucleotidyltransferase/poly(A) polymerase
LITGGWCRDKICKHFFPSEFPDLKPCDIDLLVPKGTSQILVDLLAQFLPPLQRRRTRDVFVSAIGTQTIHCFEVEIDGTLVEFDVKDNIKPKGSGLFTGDTETRDFSCNAVYYDIVNNVWMTESLKSSSGTEKRKNGLKDIKDRVLRCVDISKTFSDERRYMRAICYKNKLAFTYSQELQNKLSFLSVRKLVYRKSNLG